jgi:hypothetical protein
MIYISTWAEDSVSTRFVSLMAIFAGVSLIATGNSFTTASQDMNDGSAGSYWDLGSDCCGQEFFGFPGSLDPSYWGALITVPIGGAVGVASLITIESVTILYDPGQFGGTNDPLVGDTGGVGGSLGSGTASTGCNLIGVLAGSSSISTTIGSPEFVGGETTAITCQFASTFPPSGADTSAYYVVVQLNPLDPATLAPGGSPVGLTFLDSSPLTAAPEPMTMGLCIAGLAAIALRRRLVR